MALAVDTKRRSLIRRVRERDLRRQRASNRNGQVERVLNRRRRRSHLERPPDERPVRRRERDAAVEHAGARGRDGHVVGGRIVGQNHALRIPADKVEVGAHVVSRLALGAEYVGHREPVPGPSPRVGVDDDVATRQWLVGDTLERVRDALAASLEHEFGVESSRPRGFKREGEIRFFLAVDDHVAAVAHKVLALTGKVGRDAHGLHAAVDQWDVLGDRLPRGALKLELRGVEGETAAVLEVDDPDVKLRLHDNLAGIDARVAKVQLKLNGVLARDDLLDLLAVGTLRHGLLTGPRGLDERKPRLAENLHVRRDSLQGVHDTLRPRLSLSYAVSLLLDLCERVFL